jgi:hypothetical protein
MKSAFFENLPFEYFAYRRDKLRSGYRGMDHHNHWTCTQTVDIMHDLRAYIGLAQSKSYVSNTERSEWMETREGEKTLLFVRVILKDMNQWRGMGSDSLDGSSSEESGQFGQGKESSSDADDCGTTGEED